MLIDGLKSIQSDGRNEGHHAMQTSTDCFPSIPLSLSGSCIHYKLSTFIFLFVRFFQIKQSSFVIAWTTQHADSQRYDDDLRRITWGKKRRMGMGRILNTVDL